MHRLHLDCQPGLESLRREPERVKWCLVCTIRTTLVLYYFLSYRSRISNAGSEMVTSHTATVAFPQSGLSWGKTCPSCLWNTTCYAAFRNINCNSLKEKNSVQAKDALRAVSEINPLKFSIIHKNEFCGNTVDWNNSTWLQSLLYKDLLILCSLLYLSFFLKSGLC